MPLVLPLEAKGQSLPFIKSSQLLLQVALVFHGLFLLWCLIVQALGYANVSHDRLLVYGVLWLGMAFWLGLLGLWLLCQHVHSQHVLTRWIPPMTLMGVMLALCVDAYLIGSLSPVTGMAILGLMLTSRMMFERWMVYPTVTFGVVFMVITGGLAVYGVIPYSPLFHARSHPVSVDDRFWYYTVVGFSLPIMVGNLVLIEMLINQWQKRERQALYESSHDPLTGLYNRRSIRDALTELIRRPPDPQGLAVVLIDLDHFKQVNDVHGHLAGDEVLRKVAAALQQAMREGDYVGRYGGEEFIVVLPQTSAEQAMQVAERCRQAMAAAEISHGQQTLRVTGSCGVAHSLQVPEVRSLLAQADQALYQAKRQGRNQVVLAELGPER